MYSIATAQEKTGLTGRQIRYYEKMGLISVERTAGNQRRFSESDIERLLKIKALIEENLDVSAIKKFLDTEEQVESDELEGHRLIGTKLTSLYPVSNRAELLQLLSAMDIKPPKKDR